MGLSTSRIHWNKVNPNPQGHLMHPTLKSLKLKEICTRDKSGLICPMDPIKASEGQISRA